MKTTKPKGVKVNMQSVFKAQTKLEATRLFDQLNQAYSNYSTGYICNKKTLAALATIRDLAAAAAGKPLISDVDEDY